MFFFSFPHLHLFPLSVGDPDLAPRPEREAEEVEGQGAGQRVVDGNHVPKEGIFIISKMVRLKKIPFACPRFLNGHFHAFFLISSSRVHNFLCKRNTVEFFFFLVLSHKSLKPQYDCNCFFFLPHPSEFSAIWHWLWLAIRGQRNSWESDGSNEADWPRRGDCRGEIKQHNLAYVAKSNFVYPKLDIIDQVEKNLYAL